MPLAAIVVGLAVLLTVAAGHLGRTVADAGRARAAADAAALAGVTGGRGAAERLAAEHGATVVDWSSRGPDRARTVMVTVHVGRVSATAAASNRPGAPPPGVGGVPTLDS